MFKLMGLVVIVCLCACTPSPGPHPTQVVSIPIVSAGTQVVMLPLASASPQVVALPLVSAGTPGANPAGWQTLEACGFQIQYPTQLAPDGQGSQVVFLAPDGHGSVFIRLRRRAADEAQAGLETLALHLQLRYFPEMSSLAFTQITLKDVRSTGLPGLQRDIARGGTTTRLLVFVRPESLLGDRVAADVVYELFAQAPTAEWGAWQSLLDAILASLRARDCGGV